MAFLTQPLKWVAQAKLTYARRGLAGQGLIGRMPRGWFWKGEFHLASKPKNRQEYKPLKDGEWLHIQTGGIYIEETKKDNSVSTSIE